MQGRIASMSDLETAVQEYGFLPMFQNDVAGYSVEDMTVPEHWFVDGAEGSWEWKGPVAQKKQCVYGKLFRGRAGFVSLDWFPMLAAYRRGGLGFDDRYAEGLASHKDKQVYALVRDAGSLTTKAIKWMGDFGRGGQKGFDGVVARLQMQTYLVIEDFEYAIDKHGAPYGWGIARYATPECWLGESFRPAPLAPEPAFAQMLAHLKQRLPDASPKALERLLKG